jgi:hypothetical protein
MAGEYCAVDAGLTERVLPPRLTPDAEPIGASRNDDPVAMVDGTDLSTIVLPMRQVDGGMSTSDYIGR